MKKLSISIYIIALIALSNLLSPSIANAQTNQKLTHEEWSKTPLFQGLSVGMDISGLVGNVLGSDIISSEGYLQVNLKNRYLPIVEIGYGSIDTTDDETGIYYKTSSPYFRIGADYNIFYNKPYLPGHFTVGVRYGFSAFKYDMKAPDLVDPNWGHTAIPFSYENINTHVNWAELVLGLNSKVYKNFHMGFSLRYRIRLNMKENENSEPYYIPGFGINSTNNFGLTYNLIYKLPF